MIGGGILAIWNDCATGREAIYERWYQDEHLDERLRISGFLRGRRYQSMDGSKPAYFTYCETTTPEVLTSATYRERVDNPTPLTAAIMVDSLIPMNRTIYRVSERAGRMCGSIAVTAKLKRTDGVWNRLAALANDTDVARAELWIAVEESTLPRSREETLCGGDDKIEACLFAETLRAATAERIADDLGSQLSDMNMETGIYHLLCEHMQEETS